MLVADDCDMWQLRTHKLCDGTAVSSLKWHPHGESLVAPDAVDHRDTATVESHGDESIFCSKYTTTGSLDQATPFVQVRGKHDAHATEQRCDGTSFFI